jgi:excisionase family DNA binding protein
MAIDVALSPLLTKQEFAALLRVSPRTVDRLRERGVVEAVQLVPRGRVCYRRDDVEALLARPELREPLPVREDELEWT